MDHRQRFTTRRSSNPSSPLLMARHASGSTIGSSGRNRSKSRTRRSSHSNSITNLNLNLSENSLSNNNIPPPLNRHFSITSLDNNTILNVSLDNSLPLDYFKQDVLSVLKALNIPKWKKINKSNYKLIHLDRISGAMTNCIYKVTYKNYYALLLRLYGDVENIIDRDSELLTLIRLSKKNIGPKLLGCFSNGRFEEFLNNSITLNKHQIREPKISRMIARRMKEFHYGVNLNFDEFNQGPKSWVLIEKWLKLIDDTIINSSTTTIDEKNVFIQNWKDFKKLCLVYKEWLYSFYGDFENLKDSLKFCHNDTQYGNLLFYSKSNSIPITDSSDDDGDEDFDDEQALVDDNEITSLSLSNQMDQLSLKNRSNSIKLSESINKNAQLPIVTDTNFKYDTRLTVIDFEYAGQNPPAYDITNHFSEWMYDYSAPNENYKTDETKYPSVEERINYLNSYIQYIPGSTTPSLIPASSCSESTTTTATTTATTTTTTNSLNIKPVLNKSRSVVSMKLLDLPSNVTHLYNETIYWRSTCSIFWALWAIISKGSINNTSVTNNENINLNTDTNQKATSTTAKFELGPNGEKYKIITTTEVEDDSNNDDIDSDDEFSKPTLDDEFDHLQYALGKIGIFIGDMIQFGLLEKDSIDFERLKYVKYLDTELLPTSN